MIIKRYPYIIAVVLFALILSLGQWTASWAQAPKEEKDPIKIIRNNISVYLLTSRILRPYEREDLARLLTELENKTKDLETLRTVSLGVTDKIVKDTANMHFLLTDLDKLAQDNYSSAIGKLEKSHLESCWEALSTLAADMKKQRPDIDKPKSKLNASDYILIMNKNAVFLTGQGEIKEIADVWDDIKGKVDAAYPLWDQQYRLLLAKLDDTPDLEPEDVLVDAEVKFLKFFGRVDWYYRRLSGTLGAEKLPESAE